MDLSAIKPETLKVEIVHPATGEDTGLVIECSPRSAPEVKSVERKLVDRSLKRRNRAMTLAEIEDRNLEIMAARVVNLIWNGDASWKGKKLECTDENIRTLLAEDWLRRQVEEATGEEAAFFERPPTT